jgi:PadR family transcriptional regulator, regulatory protein PadR
MRRDSVRGHVELMVLCALRATPAHGYLVIERIREQSEGTFDLPEGSVYPALHRLERARAVRSSWEASSGRKRRVYELTARGDQLLGERQAEWTALRRGIDGLLGLGA